MSFSNRGVVISALVLLFAGLALVIQPCHSASTLEAHFIDVGQGDCILVRAVDDDINILIDAGDRGAGQKVVSYLRNAGVRKIDHLIATHPHADHIGGLPAVINAFPIGEVYMPRATHTTRTYENLLSAIKAKGLKINEAKAGGIVADTGNMRAHFVGPVGEGYSNLNDYSAVLLLRHHNIRFLFTGDAEKISEREMVRAGDPLRADVLKVGHHGSRTSTSSAFFRAVSPKIAVIMCGEGNRYGHPHPETLSRLRSAGTRVFRSDVNGDIIITSDGNTLVVTLQRQTPPSTERPAPALAPRLRQEAPSQRATPVQETYVGNSNSKIFHSSGCSAAGRIGEANRVTFRNREEAVRQGFMPCQRCNP